MDSGLTFAKAFNLRQGVALTAAHMAQLTTDIVWLQQDSITLFDGSVTQALVPHVYAALRAGERRPSASASQDAGRSQWCAGGRRRGQCRGGEHSDDDRGECGGEQLPQPYAPQHASVV
jgi:hypothetical protein